MKKQLKWAGAFTILAFGSHTSAEVIDLFTDPAGGQVVQDVVDGGAGTASQSANFPATIIGGYRDVIANLISAGNDLNNNGLCDPGDACTEVTVAGGTLSFSNDVPAVGTARIDYDGDDDPFTFDPTGLGAINFVDQTGCPVGGCSFLTFEVIFADLGFDFSVGIFTDATEFTEVTLISDGTPGITVLPFSLFDFDPIAIPVCGVPNPAPGIRLIECGSGNTNPVDITSVGGFTIGLNTGLVGTAAIDLQIGGITKDGNVPEPAILALMGLGLVGMGYSRRRKS